MTKNQWRGSGAGRKRVRGEGPSFTIQRIGDYNPDVAYRMWLYIVRGCCSWDYAISQEANVIARVGYIDILNGEAQTTDPTWYGETHQGVYFSGDAYLANVPEEGANVFTNYRGRSKLFWAATSIPDDSDVNMTVIFTFTFDEAGELTHVELNFVTPIEP